MRPARDHRQSLRRLFIATLLLAALAACTPARPRHETMFVQSADGVTAYLGVAPSALIAAHAPDHAERRMHAGLGGGNAHIMVALFDAETGARIEDAAVDASLRGERHGGSRRLRLEPMRIEDAVAYGAFATLGRDRYHLTIEARRPDRPTALLIFVYDAAALPLPD
jgi:hypothetical protein